MQIKDVEKLKAWLLTKLEPLCDADPAALAKYVVALLRKDKPKSALRELCVDQLEVFLAKETTLFVDRLFRGLDSESYLTGHDTKTPPPVAPPPNPSSKPVSKPLPSKVPPANASPPKHQSLNPPPPAKAPPTKSHSAGTRDGTQSSSSSGSNSVGRSGGSGDKWRAGGSGSDRRYLEDLRSREVDDDDRDFRRSRSRGGRSGEGKLRGVRGGRRGGGRGEEGGTVSREPDSSTGGGRRGAESEGGKARGAVGSTSGDHRGNGRGERGRWGEG